VPFRLNRNATRLLTSTPQMASHLRRVAQDVADEIERDAPQWIKRSGAKFSGEVVRGRSGLEGEARVESPFWHMAEFGTVNNPPTPYIRPAAQRVLNRRGGRLGIGT